MASDDIEQRMVRWAEWLMRSNGSGLGFPRECPYTRMQARSSVGFSSPEIDMESGETEKAVQSLSDDLKRAVQVYYLFGGTREQQAKLLVCHVRTMERRVENGRLMIQKWLDETRRVKKVATPP